MRHDASRDTGPLAVCSGLVSYGVENSELMQRGAGDVGLDGGICGQRFGFANNTKSLLPVEEQRKVVAELQLKA
ncbi:hypothetical protein [Xanthomonas vasicola]|uniref:Uncharacterized protein n=1 Tax=Xanthomonas vasicola TaxID=56459 RepID=A0ABD7S7F3_XANVA|nr:hypothetical protein [Xanthomonas vasicola]KGR45818.1 hypothetical protein NX04_04270 [Xanthomonas vasicola]KGR46051.1 hypothetical protein NX05_06115 [Xanthomonas vasicola]KGR62020.1 hypothetical protein NX79_03480 [Xanthomonas vasicola]MDO6986220.1 hypothetical protein [Xanthomonas vasicola]PPV01241.1 hypothetical protein XvhCFBP2543_18025 [Xanthomonas vasicola]